MITFEKLGNGNVKVFENSILKFILSPNNCNLSKNNYGYIEIKHSEDIFVFPHTQIDGANCDPVLDVSTVDTALTGLGTDFFFRLKSFGDAVFVQSLSDLPEPVANVITLDRSIIIASEIDLEGNTLHVPEIYSDVNGLGTNSSSLTSTGLDANTPLITFERNANLKNFTIKNVGIGFYINNSLAAHDWSRVNFENVAVSGEIVHCLFFIIDTMAFINAPSLTFSGNIISFVASPNCIWRGALGANDKQIIFEPTFLAVARVRIQDSRFTLIGSQIGIDFQAGATVPSASFEMDKVGFTGGSLAIQGINGGSLTANFRDCSGTGLVNSSPNAVAYMRNNAVSSTFTIPNTLEAILGTFLQGSETQKFTVASNGVITCNNPISRLYAISLNANVTSGNNQEVYIQGFKNGVLVNTYIGKATTNAGGKAENIVLIGNISLVAGDTFQFKIAKTADIISALVQDIIIDLS